MFDVFPMLSFPVMHSLLNSPPVSSHEIAVSFAIIPQSLSGSVRLLRLLATTTGACGRVFRHPHCILRLRLGYELHSS